MRYHMSQGVRLATHELEHLILREYQEKIALDVVMCSEAIPLLARLCRYAYDHPLNSLTEVEQSWFKLQRLPAQAFRDPDRMPIWFTVPVRQLQVVRHLLQHLVARDWPRLDSVLRPPPSQFGSAPAFHLSLVCPYCESVSTITTGDFRHFGILKTGDVQQRMHREACPFLDAAKLASLFDPAEDRALFEWVSDYMPDAVVPQRRLFQWRAEIANVIARFDGLNARNARMV